MPGRMQFQGIIWIIFTHRYSSRHIIKTPSRRTYSQATGGRAARLDIMSLDSTVQELFKAGLAPATLKVYKTGANRYHSFCVMYNVPNPFPAREDTLL